MAKNNLGPAFPAPSPYTHEGISLRDYIAVHALTAAEAALSKWDMRSDQDAIARAAYSIADAMLEKRDK